MEWKMFITVFASIFLAEMADKTQLATMLFAANSQTSKWLVFMAASLALIAASGIAVTVGSVLSQVISTRTMTMLAGVGFILVGTWTLWQGWFTS
jgi:putative Ca2+/H+ antiporter (TMEM165/GDT1 family)